MSNIPQLRTALEGENLRRKFNEVLGAKSPQFIASILTSVGNNKLLEKCDFKTIISASMVAATLDLPINPNLGFAYIIPYGKEAQFQIGYKGFIQLAQRSGKFKKINVSSVKEGEISTIDFLTGEFEFNWIQSPSERIKTETIGFVAYFELLNGFSKSLYMSLEEVKAHMVTHSKTYKSDKSPWKKNFNAMAEKTVLKMLISKYAPMSTAMEKAIVTDQSVVNDLEGEDVSYPDNDNGSFEEANIVNDVPALIKEATTKKDLLDKWSQLSEDEQMEYMTQFTDRLKTFE